MGKKTLKQTSTELCFSNANRTKLFALRYRVLNSSRLKHFNIILIWEVIHYKLQNDVKISDSQERLTGLRKYDLCVNLQYKCCTDVWSSNKYLYCSFILLYQFSEIKIGIENLVQTRDPVKITKHIYLLYMQFNLMRLQFAPNNKLQGPRNVTSAYYFSLTKTINCFVLTNQFSIQ